MFRNLFITYIVLSLTTLGGLIYVSDLKTEERLAKIEVVKEKYPEQLETCVLHRKSVWTCGLDIYELKYGEQDD